MIHAKANRCPAHKLAHLFVVVISFWFWCYFVVFILFQVSGVRKNVRGQGDIWVVAKTLKAFNRLRVAWEEDYGTTSIPVEPPPARWEECSEVDWVRVKRRACALFCGCPCFPVELCVYVCVCVCLFFRSAPLNGSISTAGTFRARERATDRPTVALSSTPGTGDQCQVLKQNKTKHLKKRCALQNSAFYS